MRVGKGRGLGLQGAGVPANPLPCPSTRSFTHFLTGVCAIIGGMFTG